MRFRFDHDYHIHSQLSACSKDPAQTPDRILRYAQEEGLKEIVLTDHFWDEKIPGASKWYSTQDYNWISQAKPLPQSEGIRFLFGAEAEMDLGCNVCVAQDRWEQFDFVVVSTTHLHMKNFTISPEDAETDQGRANTWIRRLDSLLSKDLPFHKIGIAHLSCSLIALDQESRLRVLNLLPDQKLEELFKGCADLGVGIELNFDDMDFNDDDAESILRPFRIAKAMGCKFYLGSDAHHPGLFARCADVFNRAIDLLALTEEDKFHIRQL